MRIVLVNGVDLDSLPIPPCIEDFFGLIGAQLGELFQPQAHIADCMRIYSIGAASKKRGIFDTVQYFRKPTFLI